MISAPLLSVPSRSCDGDAVADLAHRDPRSDLGHDAGRIDARNVSGR